MKKQYTTIIMQALSTTNPFMFRSETGRLLQYRDAKESYQLCLMALWSEFPAGFVDVAYFMMKYQGLTPFCINPILGNEEYCYVKIWDNHDTERLPKLRLVLQKLLQVSGCSFDEAAFGDAVATLDSLLERQGVREHLSKLNNLNIIQYRAPH